MSQEPSPAEPATAPPPRRSPRGALLRMAGLVVGGVALGLVGNAVHPAGVPLGQAVLSQAEQGQCSEAHPAAAAKAPGFTAPESISAAQALALRGQPGVVIGDLRPPRQYAEGHIAGAIHLPCSGALGQAAFDRLPSGVKLVLYDQDGSSADLQRAATAAALRGVGSLSLLQGGFSAWTLAGLPAESGTCERCDKP